MNELTTPRHDVIDRPQEGRRKKKHVQRFERLTAPTEPGNSENPIARTPCQTNPPMGPTKLRKKGPPAPAEL